MAHIVEKGTRIRTRREKRTDFRAQIFYGVMRIIGVVLALTAIFYVSRFQILTITDVEIVGGETISHDELRAQINNELEGTYFHLIPKRFTYTYPQERIIEVLSKNQRIHNINVERVTRNAITVDFDEYIPNALWCTGNGTNSCYFMTENGYAFAPAPTLHGGAFVRHYTEGLTEVTEGQVLSREKNDALITFMSQLERELGFRTASLTYEHDGDVAVAVNGGGTVFMTGTDDFSSALSNLKTVLTSQEFSHLKPGNFKYIDVRFGNKVFVNEELGTSTDEVIELSE